MEVGEIRSNEGWGCRGNKWMGREIKGVEVMDGKVDKVSVREEKQGKWLKMRVNRGGEVRESWESVKRGK